MEQKISALNGYFEEQISQCGQRSRELLADGRADEATFEKVRGNMFDIFRTVLSVAVEQSKGDTDAVRSFFALRLEQIPASWATSYDKAKEHNDTEKMRVEQIKLNAIAEIKATFARIWEEKR